jgi:hypothetical protein
MRQKSVEKSYPFVIKNINIEAIDQKFGFTFVSNINLEKYPQNVTKITDLSTNKTVSDCISFIDESKKSHRCNISMIDFKTNEELKSDFSFSCYDCFWCRSSIPENVIGIGCPIKYIPNQAVKQYYSEISKDVYTIKENITVKKYQNLNRQNEEKYPDTEDEENEEDEEENKEQENKQTEVQKEQRKAIELSNKNYYLTDGIFCSFNCCMSFITYQKSEKNASMYNLSEMLLLKIYSEIHPNVKNPVIEEAPHWRQLRKYGGDMTIEMFRNSFNRMEYKNHGFISDFPTFKSIGVMFEENLKF